MKVVEFLRLVQSVPSWDRTPAISDKDLRDLLNQVGEDFFTETKNPFTSGMCNKCVYHYKLPDSVDMCAVHQIDIHTKICSEIPVCYIFCNIPK